MGMNMRHPEMLAAVPTYRENTVESLLRAAEAGATFVEFDVQVGLITPSAVSLICHHHSNEDSHSCETADLCDCRCSSQGRQKPPQTTATGSM